MTSNKLNTRIDIKSYNTPQNLYIFPSDGYVFLTADTDGSQYDTMLAFIFGATSTNDIRIRAKSIGRDSGGDDNCLFVRKGMRCYVAHANLPNSTAFFVPLT